MDLVLFQGGQGPNALALVPAKDPEQAAKEHEERLKEVRIVVMHVPKVLDSS
jgi:hypothetical protein